MDKSDNAGSGTTRVELFRDADLQRQALASLGEWYVNVSSRGRTTIYETYPQGGISNYIVLWQEDQNRCEITILSRRRVR